MRKEVLLFLFIVTTCLLISGVSAVEPYGANYTTIDSERAPADNASSHEAIAGNVTELDISGFTTTQSWQGYFGNVSGVVQLADSDDYVMYNWTLSSPEGEVYAARNSSITWTNIQCFNFTAAGNYSDDTGQRGNTSLYGMNLTQLEAEYNISWDDVDGVNETFSLAGTHESGAGLSHDLFYTNNLDFTPGECLSTHIFNGTEVPQDSTFQEVLLYDPDTRTVVFTSILDEADTVGFDQKYHDFEMLVLEEGKGTDIDTTTYWFYVELE